MVEETLNRGFAVLASDLDDGATGPFKAHGVAIGIDDVTFGGSRQKKLWPADALREAAETLAGKPIVKNHINQDVDAVVGAVTKAWFEEGVGVVYEGELDDRELAMKVERGRLDVSPRMHHGDPKTFEETEDGELIVDTIHGFINLSLVPQGAAPSNSIQEGPAAALSAAELSALFDEEVTEEAADPDEDPAEPEDLSEDDSETVDDVEDAASTENSPGEVEDLERHAVHEPTWDGTREAPWDAPSLNDFGFESWDDLSADEKASVADHFVVSKSGFPPEDFGDLALPVVDSEGNLVLNALQNAKARASQVSGLSGEDLSRVESLLTRLADEHFDADFEDNAKTATDEWADSLLARVSADQTLSTTMDEHEKLLAHLEKQAEDLGCEPEDLAFVPKGTHEELQTELTDLQSKVEELESENEALEAEVDTVKEAYAEALSAGDTLMTPEDLAERFTVEELREKHEALVEADEAEPLGSTPAPVSGDVDELNEEDEPEDDLSAEQREEVEDLEAKIESLSDADGSLAKHQRAHYEERLAEITGESE